MNKTELIAEVAASTGLSKDAAGRAVNGALTAIVGAVARGQDVSLVGFGTFKVQERAARPGTNPKTGAKMTIQARRSPRFTPGTAFKLSVAKAG